MNTSELILHWRFRIHRVQIAHYDSARKFARLHLWLGLPAVILSTVVATSVFSSLQKSDGSPAGPWLTVLVGTLSIVSASLAGLQTFLRFSELAEKHRLAAARSIGLKHDIELLATIPPATPDDIRSALESIELRWAKIREESPNIPQAIWSHVEKTLTYEEHSKRYS